MPGTYTTLTLAQAITALAARLSDPSQTRWTAPELQVYLQWALRVWGALTAAYKDTCTFNTQDFLTATPFYDLPTVTPTLRGYTVTVDDAMALLEYHLLEPLSTGTTWAGSPQFSYQDLVTALQRRRDQFLLDTACRVSRATATIVPPPEGRVPLDQSIIEIRRAAWTTPDGVTTPLLRDDEWAANQFSPTWVQHPVQVPRGFSVGVTRPLYLQLLPPPLDTGTLDLCTVNRGDPVTTGVRLGVPDDWAWVPVFGALSDLLLRDGLALDPGRAAYAEARYQHGVSLASSAPVVLTVRVDNVVRPVGDVPSADTFKRHWQQGSGSPVRLLTLGQNLIALTPPPDLNAPSGYGITLDLVRNTPIPLTLGAYLPIGPELVDPILDYAQHLALIKEGPAQLEASQPLLDKFFRLVGLESSWQRALTSSRRALLQQASSDKRGSGPALVSDLQPAGVAD